MKLEVKQGKFGYKKNKILFEDINFSIDKGQIVTILGPNGVGKTTLLKCITSLLAWHEGQTLIDGTPITSSNDKTLWSNVSYVPQSSYVRFNYLVIDMVLMGRSSYLKVYSTPSKKDYKIAMHALEQVGIAHLHDKICTEISGGEYQLVLLARALAKQPQLLILDEPESHLDFRNQMLVLSILEKIVDENGLSCLINTHYPDHAMRLADFSLLLGRERKYLFGPADEVITTENLSDYFGVKVKLLPYEYKDRTYSSIIPLELNT
ncbi:MAG TPA: ABC transporter ATP-binding protein [Clostridia bacterium]|nr:ABC transporter ATP-binding protein [Clostridia bacterium]